MAKIELDSEAGARLRDAVGEFKRRAYDGAEEMLKALVAEYPEDDEPLGRLAYVHFARQRYEEGETLFRRAVELAPGRELWSIGLFHCLWELEDFDRAFAEMKRFIQHFPEQCDLYSRLLEDMREEMIAKGIPVGRKRQG